MSTTLRAGVPGDFNVADRSESFKPTRAENVSARFRSLLQKSTVWIWIAEQDGLAVGFASGVYVP